MSTVSDTQEQITQQPGWLAEIRRKARLAESVIPALQRDLAVEKAKLDSNSPTFNLWLKDFEQRQRARDDYDPTGEWNVDEVREDAARFGLVVPERPDYTVEAATAARMRQAAADASPPSREAGIHDRMSKARNAEELAAIVAASGGAVISE